jgi:hypothetical protein
VNGAEVGGRVAPEERHHRDAFLEADLQALAHVPGEDEVDPEGPVGELADPAEKRADLLGLAPRDRQHPERAGVRHRRHKFRAGQVGDRGLDDGHVEVEEPGQRGVEHRGERTG